MICPRCQVDTGPFTSCRACNERLGGEFQAEVYSKHIGTVHIETELPIVTAGPSEPDAWDRLLEAKAAELNVEKP